MFMDGFVTDLAGQRAWPRRNIHADIETVEHVQNWCDGRSFQGRGSFWTTPHLQYCR